MALRDALMSEISDRLNLPAVTKGVGSSVHNDFIDPLAESILGPEIAHHFPDKYRKIQAVIEALGGIYVPGDPESRGVGHTSEGTRSGGGGTLTNFGLETILDLLLTSGVPTLTVDTDDPVAELINEGFTPGEILDTRRRRVQVVASRPGATVLRNKVRAAYGNRCCISGADELAALDVAHIAPYLGAASDAVGNTLLLRADIHKLHDALLLAVSDEDLTVLIKPRLRDTAYAELEGARVRAPKEYLLSLEALRFHRQRSGL